MNPQQAKALGVGQTVYHRFDRNADGTPARWRVNGQPKTWKRDATRVSVPIKHGLWDYGYIEAYNSGDFALSAEEALSE